MEYLKGFGNQFESQSEPGTLPQGQNSPKRPLRGLVPEQLSGSAFTMERSLNFRSWLYRIHPSTFHGPYKSFQVPGWVSRPTNDPSPPSQFRWQPLPKPEGTKNFLEGVQTMAVTRSESGVGVNHYQFNRDMGDQYFYNSDAEMMFVPHEGSLLFATEFGQLEVEPQEIAVIPRGVKFQVAPAKAQQWCRGYLAENLGHPFILPNLGPLGANGLANPRDFMYPVAQTQKEKQNSQVVVKFDHNFWIYEQDHSPLDVVAWHGNYAPYKYDLRRFNTMGTVSFDHPDPSIYTVLTSPTATPGQANVDFVIFPPRWLVGENTFRPPYYHRNVMSEYMGLIAGQYDAKQGGFVPGGASLHNRMSAHGPDTETFYKAIENSEEPQKIDNTMAFMFESCHVFHPTDFAIKTEARENNYGKCWQGFKPLYK